MYVYAIIKLKAAASYSGLEREGNFGVQLLLINICI